MIPIYALAESHRPALLRHFQLLDDEDTYLRFGMNASQEVRKNYVNAIDFGRDTVFGVFSDNLDLIGVAHLACTPERAELGLSVLSTHRGSGIGSALLNRAATRARNLQIGELFMNCLTQNRAIVHIARKSGMSVSTESSDTEAWLILEPGDHMTIGREFLEQSFAQFDWALKAEVRFLSKLSVPLG